MSGTTAGEATEGNNGNETLETPEGPYGGEGVNLGRRGSDRYSEEPGCAGETFRDTLDSDMSRIELADFGNPKDPATIRAAQSAYDAVLINEAIRRSKMDELRRQQFEASKSCLEQQITLEEQELKLLREQEEEDDFHTTWDDAWVGFVKERKELLQHSIVEKADELLHMMSPTHLTDEDKYGMASNQVSMAWTNLCELQREKVDILQAEVEEQRQRELDEEAERRAQQIRIMHQKQQIHELSNMREQLVIQQTEGDNFFEEHMKYLQDRADAERLEEQDQLNYYERMMQQPYVPAPAEESYLSVRPKTMEASKRPPLARGKPKLNRKTLSPISERQGVMYGPSVSTPHNETIKERTVRFAEEPPRRDTSGVEGPPAYSFSYRLGTDRAETRCETPEVERGSNGDLGNPSRRRNNGNRWRRNVRNQNAGNVPDPGIAELTTLLHTVIGEFRTSPRQRNVTDRSVGNESHRDYQNQLPMGYEGSQMPWPPRTTASNTGYPPQMGNVTQIPGQPISVSQDSGWASYPSNQGIPVYSQAQQPPYYGATTSPIYSQANPQPSFTPVFSNSYPTGPNTPYPDRTRTSGHVPPYPMQPPPTYANVQNARAAGQIPNVGTSNNLYPPTTIPTYQPVFHHPIVTSSQSIPNVLLNSQLPYGVPHVGNQSMLGNTLLTGNANVPMVGQMQGRPMDCRPPRKPAMPLECFDGSGDFHVWRSLFDDAAMMERWTPQARLEFLKVSLRGQARELYNRLHPYRQQEYDSIMSALQARYDPEQRRHVWKTELKTVMRKPKEPLTEYMERIRQLTERSYPDVEHQVREEIAKDRFLESLAPDVQAEILKYPFPPANTEAALAIALQIESIRRSTKRAAQAKAMFLGQPAEEIDENEDLISMRSLCVQARTVQSSLGPKTVEPQMSSFSFQGAPLSYAPLESIESQSMKPTEKQQVQGVPEGTTKGNGIEDSLLIRMEHKWEQFLEKFMDKSVQHFHKFYERFPQYDPRKQNNQKIPDGFTTPRGSEHPNTSRPRSPAQQKGVTNDIAREEGLCYYCGERGHYANKCPFNPMAQRSNWDSGRNSNYQRNNNQYQRPAGGVQFNRNPQPPSYSPNAGGVRSQMTTTAMMGELEQPMYAPVRHVSAQTMTESPSRGEIQNAFPINTNGSNLNMDRPLQ